MIDHSIESIIIDNVSFVLEIKEFENIQYTSLEMTILSSKFKQPLIGTTDDRYHYRISINFLKKFIKNLNREHNLKNCFRIRFNPRFKISNPNDKIIDAHFSRNDTKKLNNWLLSNLKTTDQKRDDKINFIIDEQNQ